MDSSGSDLQSSDMCEIIHEDTNKQYYIKQEKFLNTK